MYESNNKQNISGAHAGKTRADSGAFEMKLECCGIEDSWDFSPNLWGEPCQNLICLAGGKWSLTYQFEIDNGYDVVLLDYH